MVDNLSLTDDIAVAVKDLLHIRDDSEEAEALQTVSERTKEDLRYITNELRIAGLRLKSLQKEVSSTVFLTDNWSNR